MSEMTSYAPGTPSWVDLASPDVPRGAPFSLIAMNESRGSGITSSTLRSRRWPRPSTPSVVASLCGSFAARVRASDPSCVLENVLAGTPGAGAFTGAAESRIVPKIEIVPSSLSMISMVRLCCGQSMCDAVLISKNPLEPFLWEMTSLRCVWPLTYATTFGYFNSRD